MEDRPQRKPLRKGIKIILFVATGILVLAGLLVLLRSIKVYDFVQQRGPSMEPSIEEGTVMFVMSGFKKYKRGDIVMTETPSGGTLLVKRIVGLPGEKVEIKDGNVFIDGAQLDESDYLPADTNTYPSLEGDTFTLEQDEYFLLGDNRSESFDSRATGPEPADDILWKVVIQF